MIIIVRTKNMRYIREMNYFKFIFYRIYLKCKKYEYETLKKGDF